uniref:Uncharacterized protein n=1 Tax=Arundo donax TaxID=35708 RepID=A0A0A9BHT1_ARUDO
MLYNNPKPCLVVLPKCLRGFSDGQSPQRHQRSLT